jgi:hypothetical protein
MLNQKKSGSPGRLQSPPELKLKQRVGRLKWRGGPFWGSRLNLPKNCPNAKNTAKSFPRSKSELINLHIRCRSDFVERGTTVECTFQPPPQKTDTILFKDIKHRNIFSIERYYTAVRKPANRQLRGTLFQEPILQTKIIHNNMTGILVSSIAFQIWKNSNRIKIHYVCI